MCAPAVTTPLFDMRFSKINFQAADIFTTGKTQGLQILNGAVAAAANGRDMRHTQGVWVTTGKALILIALQYRRAGFAGNEPALTAVAVLSLIKSAYFLR